jgi:hypothetical protein
MCPLDYAHNLGDRRRSSFRQEFLCRPSSAVLEAVKQTTKPGNTLKGLFDGLCLVRFAHMRGAARPNVDKTKPNRAFIVSGTDDTRLPLAYLGPRDLGQQIAGHRV